MSKESIQKITRGIIYNGLATGVVTVLGFATSIILARYFGKNEYGKLIIVYTIVSFFTIFTNFGIGGALVRFIPKYIIIEDKNRLNVFTFSAGAIVLVLSASFSFFLFLSANLIASHVFSRPEVTYVIQIGSFYLFFYSILYFLTCIFQGLQNWKAEAILSVCPPLIYFSGIIIVEAIGFNKINVVLIINVLACFASIIWGFYFLFTRKHINIPDIDMKEIFVTVRETFTFGYPLLFSAFTFYLMIWFDRLILGANRSNEELTVYYIATMILNGFMMMFKVFFTVLSPYVAEIDPNDLRETENKFKLLFKWFLYLCLVFAMIMYFIIDPLIVKAYGENWHTSALIVKVLLLVFILRGASNPIHMFLVNVFQQTKEVAKISLLVVVTNVILNLTLIPFFGYWGAAFSTIAAFFVAWIYMVLYIDTVKNLLPKILLWKSLISIGVVILINIFCNSVGIYNPLLMFSISFSIFILLQWLQGELCRRDIEFCHKVIKSSLAHS